MTLREAHLAAAEALALKPDLREYASRDAAALLLHVLDLPRAALYAHSARSVTPAESSAFADLVARRLNHEPIQYILGASEFYGMHFNVTPAVLIPRPETELLVEAALDRLPRDRALRVLDVGTGSGAIAVALAHHLPLAQVLAVDVSPDALAVAKDNALRNHVADRIEFRLSDLLADVASIDVFDAILSNPPYIPEADRLTLHPQVRHYEPAAALFAGSDGLAVYRRLIPQAWEALKGGGLLGLELGYSQSEEVLRCLKDWGEMELLNDLQGIPRVAFARKAFWGST